MSEDQNSSAAVAEPEAENQQAKPRRQPPYNVLLHDDDAHTVNYVVAMMQELFHMRAEDGMQIAKTVHLKGRAICLTTTREHAELKRDQIHSYGADRLIPSCKGSMSASIEPAH